MEGKNPRSVLRGIDANGNRAAEGLRVLEDVARFFCDDEVASRQAKEVRHAVRAAIPEIAVGDRDTAGDVGTTIASPTERGNLVGLIRANAKRVQEALRTAEEFAKLAGRAEAAAALESARYRSYQLESRLLSRMPAWLFWRVKLYALVDTSLTDKPVEVASAVARGGAGAIQLRAKALSETAYRELAERVQEACRKHGALFVVNDHVAVAKILNADAVHVGQDDLTIADARQVVSPLCAIGVSTHTPEQIAAACALGADYLGIGPMYATATKAHEPARGPELLDAARRLSDRPTFAIGGLDLARIKSLRSRLPHGVAVAGALCRAEDPERTAADICALLESEDQLLREAKAP